MMTVIKAQGYNIAIEGWEFGNYEAEFNMVCAEIERAAAEFDSAALAAIVWDEAKDDFADARDTRFQELANTLCNSTLERLGWYKPSEPWVSVSATLIQAKP
jgi:hypothetical protein